MKKLTALILAMALSFTLFTACSSERKVYDEETLVEILTNAMPEEAQEVFPPEGMTSEFVQTFFLSPDMGLYTQENYESGAFSASAMNTKAHTVVIMQAAEGKEEEALEEVTAHYDMVYGSFETYLPDQFELAKAGIVKEEDNGIIILVIAQDAQAIYDSIVEQL